MKQAADIKPATGTGPARIRCFEGLRLSTRLGLLPGRRTKLLPFHVVRAPLVVVAATLLLIALGTGPAWALDEAMPLGPSDPAEFERFVNGLIVDEMERLDVPGAAFVAVRNGQVFFIKGYRFADREGSVPVDALATLFGIGSVTKPLTAVAALQQVERGNLDLDADINTYLDFPVAEEDSSAVTLGSLLTHTSGFEERRIGIAAREASAIQPLGDFLEDNVPARFADTGEVHSYCNFGYAFVGHLVERASGQDFADYMEDNVFAPLGMESSAFNHKLPRDLAARLAVGYVGGEGKRRPAAPTYERDYPAGDVVTTTADMGTFMIALLENGGADGARIMDGETVASYLATSYRPDPSMPGRTTGGLEEQWINGERVVGHGGDTLDGFGAQMILMPQYRTGFFLVYNVDTADEFREHVMAAIFDRYYPGSAPEPTFVELDGSQLERFAGTYRQTRFARSKVDKILALTPPYNTFVSANSEGTLTVSFLGVDQTWDYRPTGTNAFTQVSGEPTTIDGLVVDPGKQISFSVNDGEVRYLHTSLHTIALERVPLPLIGVVQISSYVVIVILFAISLIVWPAGALIRRLRNRPKQTGWALGALLLSISIAVTMALGTVLLFLGLGTDAAYGATTILYGAAGLITLSAAASLLLIPAAVGAWWNRWFSVGGRIYYTLLALLAPALLWWTIYWNLFGFHF